MELDVLAQKLIEAVDGLVTEKGIAAALEVFDGLMQGINNRWEQHLAEDTTDLLMYDSVICDCGRLIEVKRDRQTVYHTA